MECAHSDTIWACGIRLNEEDRFDAAKWRGQNLLGFALMEVRAMLRSVKNKTHHKNNTTTKKQPSTNISHLQLHKHIESKLVNYSFMLLEADSSNERINKCRECLDMLIQIDNMIIVTDNQELFLGVNEYYCLRCNTIYFDKMTNVALETTI